jgi:hypothetical protein
MKAYYRLFAPGALFVLMTAAAGLANATLIQSVTTLTVGPYPGTAGSPVTLTATIAPQGQGPLPTGTVVFTVTGASTEMYTSPVISGAATLILEPAAGTYTYTAAYSGDANFTNSTSAPFTEPVTSPTTTTFTVNPNPALFGAPVTLTATVSPNTATGTVTFYEHSTVVGVAPLSGGTATFTATLLPSGLRTLYARYSGDNTGDAPSTSANLSEAILTKAGLGFGPPLALPVAGGSSIQVAGDFNGDHITDLAILNAGTSTIQIFLGTGEPATPFSAGATLTTGSTPVGLVTGDFNGDGILDLAVAASDGVEVLYGSGGGAFLSYVSTSIGGAASSLAVADFNKDGYPDIVAVSGTTLSILISNGAAMTFNVGLFTPTTLGSGALAAGVGDFNNDGLADVVVVTSAGANVLLNTSNLAAVTPTYSFAAPVIYAAGNGPNAVLIKDVNGDGNQDLLITNFTDGTVSVLTGTGTGTFSVLGAFAVGPAPTSIASSDFNGDGISDLIVTNATTYNGAANNNISVMLGYGNGTYHPALGYSAGPGPSSIIVADFNGDNKPDAAVLSASADDLDILLNLYATVTITQGNTQSAAVNNTFAQLLQVTATAFGSTVANVPVTFTPPVSGAGGFFQGANGGSATAVSNAFGVASAPPYTANGTTGSDTVSATAGSNVVNFALTNNLQTCTFQVSPSGPITFDANGGAQLFTVTTAPGCMWNAASSSPSVVVPTTMGTGSGTVDVLFPTNTSGFDITETVLIAGIQVTATVLQTKQIFADVPPTAFYFDAANLMYTKGITSGCSTNPLDYCPNNSVLREQMAVFIVTAVYNDQPFTLNNPDTQDFTDVPPASFGYDQIEKMYELGITGGCSGVFPDLQFCPTDSVTRAQMAIFIIKARYGSNTAFDIPSTPYFTDVPVGSFGYEYIQRMAYDGITSGCSPTTYCPNDVVNRGQMAIFIMKGMFNELYAPTTPEIISISPATIPLTGTTTVTVTGSNTLFDGTTVVNAVAGNLSTPAYTVGAVTVISPTSLTVQLTPVDGVVTTQPYSIFITTSDHSQEVTLPNGLTITPDI